MARIWHTIARWLGGLSFRTGVIVAACCVVCYAVSFAQMLLPMSVTAKGILWVVFFGMAKTLQYAALLILGKAGWQRLRQYLGRSRAT